MSITIKKGRLGNQIIINIAVSLIAEKFNLHVDYSSQDLIINSLGIKLFVGLNKYSETVMLTDDNYIETLAQADLKKNVNSNNNYFQTMDISKLINAYLKCDSVRHNIIRTNIKWNSRYKNNNDIFIHVRLTDVAHYNPGALYYLNAIRMIETSLSGGGGVDMIYISTDDSKHSIITEIMSKYSAKCKLIDDNTEVNSIQFGSTCKYVILSHGTFSVVIGYLSFYSTVIYPEYIQGKIWFGDMFTGHGWIQLLQSQWGKITKDSGNIIKSIQIKPIIISRQTTEVMTGGDADETTTEVVTGDNADGTTTVVIGQIAKTVAYATRTRPSISRIPPPRQLFSMQTVANRVIRFSPTTTPDQPSIIRQRQINKQTSRKTVNNSYQKQNNRILMSLYSNAK